MKIQVYSGGIPRLGVPASVQTNGAATASAGYQYDAAGRLWQKTYGNNDVATYSYDVESRLLSLGITNGTTLVQAYTYGWDAGETSWPLQISEGQLRESHSLCLRRSRPVDQ